MYVRLRGYRRRARSRWRRLWDATLAGDPRQALRGQLHAARQDARGPRDHRAVPRAARVGPQPHVAPARRAGRHRLRRSPGPTSTTLAEFSDRLRAEGGRAPGHRRRRHHAAHGQAEPAGAHRPRAGGGAGRRRPGDRRDAAGRRRRRRPRLALSTTRRPTTPTTWSCGWWASTARDTESISQLYVRAMQPATEPATCRCELRRCR